MLLSAAGLKKGYAGTPRCLSVSPSPSSFLRGHSTFSPAPPPDRSFRWSRRAMSRRPAPSPGCIFLPTIPEKARSSDHNRSLPARQHTFQPVSSRGQHNDPAHPTRQRRGCFSRNCRRPSVWPGSADKHRSRSILCDGVFPHPAWPIGEPRRHILPNRDPDACPAPHTCRISLPRQCCGRCI